MRNNMRFNKDFLPPSIEGSLLIAHPGLLDPNFCKSVILISTHSVIEGSIGVVVNHPLHQTMSQYDFHQYEYSPLADVPLYFGGPVAVDEMIILTAWQWLDHEGVFKLYFGIPEHKAIEIIQQNDPAIEIRAFLGYSGWTYGQLESELSQQAWFISSVKHIIDDDIQEDSMWKTIIAQVKPELLFLANTPDDNASN